jgi:hypothetical protein
MEREPIDDTEVAGATAPIGQPGEPVAEAPAEPDVQRLVPPRR